MKKFLIACMTLIACSAATSKQHDGTPTTATKSIYDFSIKALDGSTIEFSSFKGKKILIVNTASMCGYTRQYKGLEELYKKHKDKLVVVGFPSDNFGKQEYEKDEDIKDFCEKNFGVTFPLTTRVNVKGDNVHPIFQYLCNKDQNGVLDASIGWNFGKFLIDEKGNLVKYFPSKTEPDSEELAGYLK